MCLGKMVKKESSAKNRAVSLNVKAVGSCVIQVQNTAEKAKSGFLKYK